ncbi:hypothetical protein [Flavobacterium suncheonense]|uniref:Uncharacterized protein n=1 Tax=Flavobacterium suncheonense GH29-5 = DSM 17707 TaxID=1121899 RepID=A0A0A2MA56_9FLAO|nr:hypothetical protein [Flavobacterium suncheonense]KGO89557.1 hypothetical protein Q764_07240 [Flavobacterium suncheonense GH29-5 = DSM 17707]
MTSNALQNNDVLRAMTKQELMNEFRIFGERTVRAEINNVIAKMRGIPLKEAKDQKAVRASEVEEIKKRFQ